MNDEPFELIIDNPDKIKHAQIVVYSASPLTGQPKGIANKNRKIRKIVSEVFKRSRSAFFKLYDPAEHTHPGSHHSKEEVYRTNLVRTIQSDLLFIHAVSQSYGVGIEAKIASSVGIPNLIAHPTGIDVSRMLTGMFSTNLATIEYDSLSDFREKLKSALPAVALGVIKNMPHRRRICENVISAGIGRFVLRQRIRLGLTRKEVAEKARVSESVLCHVELIPEYAVMMSQYELTTLAYVLDFKSRPFKESKLRLQENEIEQQIEKQSLDSLVEFVIQRGSWNERHVLEMWQGFTEMRTQGVVGRDPLDGAYSEEDWAKLYCDDQNLAF